MQFSSSTILFTLTGLLGVVSAVPASNDGTVAARGPSARRAAAIEARVPGLKKTIDDDGDVETIDFDRDAEIKDIEKGSAFFFWGGGKLTFAKSGDSEEKEVGEAAAEDAKDAGATEGAWVFCPTAMAVEEAKKGIKEKLPNIRITSATFSTDGKYKLERGENDKWVEVWKNGGFLRRQDW